ncbi:ABC transporter permease [Nitriliruptor alkaliphilus]|uniref:ABC transporter permease n=1 Tax=Nitriliruptor alkaliphilus TaxID=427918 RepID=UPI000A5C10C3|nr:ABC transporter permease [Nitriliruptor alkaliphilus]
MRSRSQQGWAFSGPALLFTAIFFVGPMALVLATSLWTRIGGAIDRTPTLANYERILTDPVFRGALQNSLEVVLLTIVVSLLLAYPFAYLVAYRVPARWQGPLLLLAVLPFWTSYVVRSYSWLLVLARNGVVNRTLLETGLIASPITLANTRTATVVAFVHFFTMVLALTIYASLRQIPDSLRKAARDLGASNVRTFMSITLPLSLPGVVVGAFLTFVLAIGDFITPQIVGGGNELLLPQAIMLQVDRRGDFPLAAAMSVVLLAIVALVYLASARKLTLASRS